MAAVRQHLEQVELARELGFSSVWTTQHFLSYPFMYFQSVPLLAGVAAAAEGMTVGTFLLLTLLNPVEVAENAATLDAIAGGRFVLGVGMGYRAVENAAFGVGQRRADLFERKLEVLRRLLSGEAVTAEGAGFQLADARLTLVPDRLPPIWLGADSDTAVRRAARLGDAWFVPPHTRLDELERQMRLYRAARAEHGLPAAAASTPVIKEVCVAATDEEALEVARPYLKDKYDAYVDWGQSDVLPPADTLRREFAELTAGGRFVLGSPETCAAILADHVDRLGVDHFVCRLQWPGMPQQQVLNSMRLLAREVWPALHDRRARNGGD